jgi:hypothetical protein
MQRAFIDEEFDYGIAGNLNEDASHNNERFHPR